MLEALWTGTPVIGSDRGGIGELVGQWGGGVLFDPGDAKQLANLLSKLDFYSMRRDPAAFQTAWLKSFEDALETLLADQSCVTPVMHHA